MGVATKSSTSQNPIYCGEAPDAGVAVGTINELADALASRRISASTLLEQIIKRIEALDTRLNAVVVRDFERAREAAHAADIALSQGERRPLLGIPFTVKEAINVAGLPTTWGFPEFKDFIPKEDALITSRAKRAGAVLLGKTNVPLGLGDFQSHNDIYGTTNNPWDVSRSPGGSSGGSAAAIAAGFGSLSFGSDIGGSLRVPAHFCGIYAHKPRFGLVPFRGYNRPPRPPMPVRGDLGVIGPLARTAADLASALDVIAGPDEESEGIGYRLALPAARHSKLRDFRVLVIDTHALMPTDAAVRGAINTFAETHKIRRQTHQKQRFVTRSCRIGPNLHEAFGRRQKCWRTDQCLRENPIRSRSAKTRRQQPRGRTRTRHGHKSSRLAARRRRARPLPGAVASFLP